MIGFLDRLATAGLLRARSQLVQGILLLLQSSKKTELGIRIDLFLALFSFDITLVCVFIYVFCAGTWVIQLYW